MAHLQADPDRSSMRLDSTVGRAHVSAAGAPKNKGEPAPGRSRGGFSTQIHILADRRARPLHLRVTGGQHHDSTQAWVLGRVGLGFQPEPSRHQVQKTQEPLRVFVVASGHAAPLFESADAPFHGLTRLVPFRVVGLGVQASAPGRKDGLDVPWRQPGAEAVVVIGPVRDQAGQGRVAVFPQGAGLGAVVARAARHAQAQGTAPAIR